MQWAENIRKINLDGVKTLWLFGPFSKCWASCILNESVKLLLSIHTHTLCSVLSALQTHWAGCVFNTLMSKQRSGEADCATDLAYVQYWCSFITIQGYCWTFLLKCFNFCVIFLPCLASHSYVSHSVLSECNAVYRTLTLLLLWEQKAC